MDHSPKICPRCRQANFPIAEFCRHCGESISEQGPLSRGSVFGRSFGHVVDGLFWIVDEFVRWWEIAKICSGMKRLKAEEACLLGKTTCPDSGDCPPDAQARLAGLTEEIHKQTAREEFLRRHSWAMTPELVFGCIVAAFVVAAIWLRPASFQPGVNGTAIPAVFQGPVQQTIEIPISGFGVIKTAAWHGGRLYIGGDGGLVWYEPQTGVASAVTQLPPRFFVRHVVAEGNRLLIAGYGGLYALENGVLSPLYDPALLPVQLFNRLALMGDGHFMATLGQGVLRGRRSLPVVLLGTAGYTVTSFAWLDGDLWLLHERGILKGDGTTFEPLQIPVLDGKTLTAMAAEQNALYIGTTDGVIAAFKSGQSWVWTPLNNSPKQVRDLYAAAGALFVATDDGLFRYAAGAFQGLASKAGPKVIAAGDMFMAVISLQSAQLLRFASAQPVMAGSPISAPIIPMIGTFALNPVVAPTSPSPTPTAVVAPTTPIAPLPTQVPGFAVVPNTVPAPQPSPTPQNVTPFQPAAASPIRVLDTALPQALTSPSASMVKWDGKRLWAGTTSMGLWVLENGTWRQFSQSSGDLRDNRMTSLWMLQGKPFAFGWNTGILALDSGKPQSVLPAEKCDGFIGLGGNPDAPLALFSRGRVFRVRNQSLEPLEPLPPLYQQSSRGVTMVDGRVAVIADSGVLTASGTEWIFYPYPDHTSGKAFFSILAGNGTLYVAKNDGNVYAFARSTMQRLGDIGERATSIAYEGTVYVGGARRIYKLAGSQFVPHPNGVPENLLNIQPIGPRGSIVVATTGGIFAIPFIP